MKDYYKEFSLDQTKSSAELQDELFKQRKKWMQRQNAPSAEKQQEAKEKVKLIDEAQDVFATESSKKAYDEKLKLESAPKPSSTTTTSSGSKSSGSTSPSNSGSSGSSSSYSSGSSNKTSSSYNSGSSSKSSSSYNSGSSSKSSSSYNSSSSSGSSSSYNSGSSSGTSSSYNSSSSSYKPVKKKRKGFKRLVFIILLIAVAYYKKDFLMEHVPFLAPAMERIPFLASSVPVDAVEWNDHHYKVYDNADSWVDARRKCEKKGGHLVTISSAKENDFVYSYMVQEGYTQAYIGLYNASYGDDPSWKWVTGQKFKYKNWGEGEPNNTNGGIEYYGEYYNGAWNDCSLSSTTQYICEWDAAEENEEDKKEKQDLDYIEYDGHIYKVFSNADSWTDAKERAEEMGGYLACITSAKENAALLKLMRRSGEQAAYFGLYNTGQNKKGYTYGWVSGEEFSYKDWAEGQPDNYSNNELYGGFWEVGGHWNDFTHYAIDTYIVEWNSEDDVQQTNLLEKIVNIIKK